MKQKFLLILAILFCATFQAEAGESLVKRDEWEKLKDGHNYDEKLPEKKQEKKWANTKPIGSSSFNFDMLLKFLAYAGVVIILLIAIYFIIRRMGLFDKINAKGETALFEELSKELPLENELKKLLNEAVKNNDLRLAIRLLYALMLIQMHHKQWIIFSEDKTPGQYLLELPESQTRKGFSELIRVYERTWFGNIPLTEKAWESSFRLYESLLVK